MCVIADADRPVALGGVMGGLETEIGPTAKNVLIEAANFTPLSIRNTARKLVAAQRFVVSLRAGHRSAQLDWASRRCCQLILELAGGELLARRSSPVFAAARASARESRFASPASPRSWGSTCRRTKRSASSRRWGSSRRDRRRTDDREFVPPTWRRDITREIDLIEEVARIHGYDKIPQDVTVPLHRPAQTVRDRVRRIDPFGAHLGRLLSRR